MSGVSWQTECSHFVALFLSQGRCLRPLISHSIQLAVNLASLRVDPAIETEYVLLAARGGNPHLPRAVPRPPICLRITGDFRLSCLRLWF